MASQDLPTVSMQLPLPPMARGGRTEEKKKEKERERKKGPVDVLMGSKT